MLVATIESTEFKNDLIEEIELQTNAQVDSVNVAASIDEKEDDNGNENEESVWSIDRWLDPFTYERLQWIIVGALLCIVCICCLLCCRCYFVCCRDGKAKGKRNGYQAGNALFNSAQRPSSMDADDAFQSDLKNAIEMNNRGKLLKTSKSDKALQDVDVDDVAVAFDMDFDDTNGGKADSAKTKLLSSSTKTKKNGKKESEGAKETQYVTPGGPDDDEENPPPAPAPPKDLQNMDEYDLL